MRKMLVALLAFLVSSPTWGAISRLQSKANFSRSGREPSNWWSGSQGIAGPRPRVDVTAFGAKGDGSTDDTAAIQAAIDAACTSTGSGGGTIYFPPAKDVGGVGGVYILSQAQLPSTAPIFSLCSGLHFQGGNSRIHGGAQFAYAPGVTLTVQNLGANPNDAPVFAVGSNAITFENLNVVGYNQAFAVGNPGPIGAGVTGVIFKNVTGSLQNTGHANNVFYYVTNALGIHWQDSAGQVASNQYIWGFDDTNSAQPVGLIFIDGGTYVGCPVKYTNNTDQKASGPGSWFIRNLWGEVCNSDLISITNPGGGAFPLISNIHLDNFSVSDSSCNTCALINMNSAGTTLQGVTITNSTVGNGGRGVAIRQTAGSVIDWHAECGSSFCVGAAVDANSNPLATGIGTNLIGGRDFVANAVDPSRMDSHYAGVGNADAPIARFFAGGNSFSGLALDATGVFFNDATNRGYNTALQQNSREALDISFAKILSPTVVTGTPTTGGTLAANTYFAWVSTTSDNCTTISAISLPSAGIVVGGGNNAITVRWTLPPITAVAPNGYCVALSTNTILLPVGALFVSGASTTSATVNSNPRGQQQIAYNTFQGVHRFTPKALGVNTTNPQFNLDVAGTGRFTGAVTIGGGTATNKILMGSGTLTYTAIATQTCQEKIFTLTGSATTGIATASPADSLGSTNLSWSAWVSATNIVSVRVCNPSSSNITPSAVTWNVRVAQ